LSVGASDAGILASDFCDAPTDTPLLAAGSKTAENRYANLLLASFVYILAEGMVRVSKQ